MNTTTTWTPSYPPALCLCGHWDDKHTRRDGGCRTCRGGCHGFQPRKATTTEGTPA